MRGLHTGEVKGDMHRRPPGYWPDVISEAICDLGGEAQMSPEIYDWIEQNIALLDRDLKESSHQGRPSFHHTVRAIANRMVKRGVLERVGRGIFRLPHG